MGTFEFKTLSSILTPNEEPTGDDASSVNPIYGISSIVSLIIRKQSTSIVDGRSITTTGSEIKLIPWETMLGTVNTPFVSLYFTESLVEGIMYGSLVVNDFKNWTDEFGFSGEEVLLLDIKIPGHGRSPNKTFTSQFKIIEVKAISNDADTSATYEGAERLSLRRLYFCSDPIGTDSDNFLPEYLDGGYIGAISTIDSAEDPGIINTLFEKFEETAKFSQNGVIDISSNVCYLKNESVAYPWGKPLGGLRVFDLLNYIADNTVDANKQPHYFWWHDRNGWNFRNLTNINSTSENGDSTEPAIPVDGFIVTTDETNPNRILEIQTIAEYNFDILMKNNAFISSYNRLVPNWDNPYSDFTNHHDSIDSNIIEYMYGENNNVTTPIVEKYELISKKNKTNLIKNKIRSFELKKTYKINGDIHGYFNNNFANTPHFTGLIHGGQWDSYGNTAGGMWNDNVWQAQFDMTDLSGAILQQIAYDIKLPLMRKRNEYSTKKNIKRKWEVFRCTVCCHENGAMGSTADIALLNNPGPASGFTYNALFGPTGIFSDLDQEYKLSAAGSFTDLLNYDRGSTLNQRGLTYSYDLTKEPYNQTIGQFFNLVGPDAPNAYIQHVIQRAQSQYQIIIDQLDSKITDLTRFNGVVEGYKTTADDLFRAVQIDRVDSYSARIKSQIRHIDLLRGYEFVGQGITGEVITDWPITSYEFGMVPHSAIPANTGIGQVVFEFGVGCNGERAILPLFQGSGTGPNICCGPTEGRSCYNVDSYPDADPCETPLYYSVSDCYRNQCSVAEVRWCCDPIHGYCRSCQNNEDQNHSWSLLSDCVRACGTGGNICWTCDPALQLHPNNNPSGDVATDCRVARTCEPGTYPTYIDCAENCLRPGFVYCGHMCGNNFSDIWRDGSNLCHLLSSSSQNSCNGLEITLTDFGYSWFEGLTACRANCFDVIGGVADYSNDITEKDIIRIGPECLQTCSTDPIIRGFIKRTTEDFSDLYPQIYQYAAPYLWDETLANSGTNLSGDWSFHDYGTESGLIPGVVNPETKAMTKSCLQDSYCYNTTCLSAVALEVLRRTCLAEVQLLQVEKTLIESLQSKIVGYEEKWKTHYKTWYERNAFFFSKQPGKSIFRDIEEEQNTVTSPLSLFNIKSVTRKEIRGSRYEIFAKSKGITGASAGAWAYNVFFGNDPGNTAHPYYNQGYVTGGSDSFITSREPHSWYGYKDADNTDDPNSFIDGKSFDENNFAPVFRGGEFVETAIIHIGNSGGISNLIGVDQDLLIDLGNAQSDLSADANSTFSKAFNFYNTNSKKPPNVKKEEITSYVRIEFNSPIGMDRIREFPDGFVRDAGIEYFLPYLVQLTPGPMGRQGVKYNSAVIGMDPYGFDVAVKKIKDDIPVNRKLQGIDKGNRYQWWNHDTGSVLSKTSYLSSDYNGMDLWPEVGFETDYPYYSYDASQEDLHGGGYDMDFHMGGGYNFDNESQNWTESLYHYGMSSKKQFDPLYRTSVVGSYILPNSYRKLKPHRSWWSMFVPRNLFIPIRFANMFQTPNTKARDLFGGKAILSLTSNYWRTWYGSEFEDWISVTPLVKPLLEATDLSFHLNIGDKNSSINPHNTSLNGYFTDSLMYYLSGDFSLYRPSLVVEDLWKYDVSGETEYGLITPPVDTEHEFFDRNFAMQFTVHSRNSNSSGCENLGLKCSHNMGIVYSRSVLRLPRTETDANRNRTNLS